MAIPLDSSNAVQFAAMLVPIIGSIALFSFLAVSSWSDARRKEREAYYRNEMLKKLAETSGDGTKAAIELLHSEERRALIKRREGIKLGGLITLAVGIALMVFLRAASTERPRRILGRLASSISRRSVAAVHLRSHSQGVASLKTEATQSMLEAR